MFRMTLYYAGLNKKGHVLVLRRCSYRPAVGVLCKNTDKRLLNAEWRLLLRGVVGEHGAGIFHALGCRMKRDMSQGDSGRRLDPDHAGIAGGIVGGAQFCEAIAVAGAAGEDEFALVFRLSLKWNPGVSR